MKKKVKHYSQQNPLDAQDRRRVLKEFSRMLDTQVINNFEQKDLMF